MVIGVAVIEVAVHLHLPGDFHGFAVNSGVDRPPVFRVGLAVGFGDGDNVLAIGKHIAGFRIALRAQAVHARHIGNFHHFVGFHHIAADARHAVIRFILHIHIAAVISLVGKRHMRVVQIAVGHAAHMVILQKFARFGGDVAVEDIQALVAAAPAGGAVHIKHGNAHQLAHRGHAQHAHFARLAARVKRIILV